MANGRATFTFGGAKRTLDIPLGLAVEIEDAAGISVAEMVQAGPRLRFGHALIVIGKCLEWHGIDVTEERLLDWAEETGMAETTIAAVQILVAFFDRPSKAKGGAKQRGKANGAAMAPDALT